MVARALQALFFGALVLTVVVAVTAVGGSPADDLVVKWLYNGLMAGAAAICLMRALRTRAERAAWLCFAIALMTYTAGEAVWTSTYAGRSRAPYPSAADALWLLFYPAAYAGIVLLVRARVREFRTSLWLDGLLGGLTAAAFGTALVFPTVRDATHGSAGVVATTLAYPLGDLVLLGLAVGLLALTGWRPGRAWTLIALGLAANAIGDAIYTYQSANGTWTDGSLHDVLFPVAALLIAWAAHQPPARRTGSPESWRVVLMPAALALTALLLGGYGLFAGLDHLAAALLVAAGLVALVRFTLIFDENQRMLQASRKEATTDALTGLANRRALMRDLPKALSQLDPDAPRSLVLFDLDGFKRYNDSFGHPAGDALLARLGGQLRDSIRPFGRTYRLGGDEFCILVRASYPGLESVIATASAALTEHGDGFEVRSSHGAVEMPVDTRDASEALRLADQRMYGRKESRTSGAGRQTRDVLLGLLREHQPQLHDHLQDVARLARLVGERLGIGTEALDELIRAAELHDIGKVAVPDAILGKPGPLDDEEWAFMRRHTTIGQRILGAASALRPVGRIVRASQERWDGQGYPDGLAGEQIPLAARIVLVCDAFDAMTAECAYRPSLSREEALAELRAGAGAQFDPRIVEAFCGVLDQEGAAPRTAADLTSTRRG